MLGGLLCHGRATNCWTCGLARIPSFSVLSQRPLGDGAMKGHCWDSIGVLFCQDALLGPINP